MYLRPDVRMSAGGLWTIFSSESQRGDERLVRHGFTIVSLTPEVTGKRVAKRAAGLGTIPCQRNCRAPQPRAQSHMAREADRLKPSVSCHKAIHGRQVEIGGVRDDLQSCELDSPRPRSLRHGRSFHVHSARTISFA